MTTDATGLARNTAPATNGHAADHQYSAYGDPPENSPAANRMLRQQLHRSLQNEQALRNQLAEVQQSNRALTSDVKALRNQHHAEETGDNKVLRAKLHDMRGALEASEQRHAIAQRDLKTSESQRQHDVEAVREKFKARNAELQRRLTAKAEQVKQLQREKEELEVDVRELQSIIRAKNARLQDMEAKENERFERRHSSGPDDAPPRRKNGVRVLPPLEVTSSEEEEEEAEPLRPPPKKKDENRAVRFSVEEDERKGKSSSTSGRSQHPSHQAQSSTSSPRPARGSAARTGTGDDKKSPAAAQASASRQESPRATSASKSGQQQSTPSGRPRQTEAKKDTTATPSKESTGTSSSTPQQQRAQGRAATKSTPASSSRPKAKHEQDTKPAASTTTRGKGNDDPKAEQKKQEGPAPSSESKAASRSTASKPSPKPSPQSDRKTQSMRANTKSETKTDSPALSRSTPGTSRAQNSNKSPTRQSSAVSSRKPPRTPSPSKRSSSPPKRGGDRTRAGAEASPIPTSPTTEYKPGEIAAIMIQSAYRGWTTRKSFEQTVREPTGPALTFIWKFHQARLTYWSSMSKLTPRPDVDAQLDKFIALGEHTWERDIPRNESSATPESGLVSEQHLAIHGDGDPSVVVAGYVHRLQTRVPAPRRLLVLYHSVGADPVTHNNSRWTLQRVCATLVDELGSTKRIPRSLDDLRVFCVQLLRAASLVTRVLLVLDRCDALGADSVSSDLFLVGLPDNVKVIYVSSRENESLRHAHPRPQELEIPVLDIERAEPIVRAQYSGTGRDSDDSDASRYATTVLRNRTGLVPLYLSQCLARRAANPPATTPPTELATAVTGVLESAEAMSCVQALAFTNSPLPLAAVRAVVGETVASVNDAATWTIPEQLLSENGGPLSLLDLGNETGTWVCLAHPAWAAYAPVVPASITSSMTSWAIFELTGNARVTSSKKTAARTWDGSSPGCAVALRDLPRLLQASGGDARLVLNDINYIIRRCSIGTAFEFAQDLHAAGAAGAMPELLELIEDNTTLLEDSPHTLIQEAANLSPSSDLVSQARDILERPGNSVSCYTH